MERMERMITREVKSRYPLTTSDLTDEEMIIITDILAIDNPAPHQISRPDFPENFNGEIKHAIQNIQPVLRRSHLVQMLPGSVGREAQLCATHNEFNPYVIGHINELLKAEVNDRMDTVDKYADQIEDFDWLMLRSVQSLRRLWGEAPPDEVRELPINYPHPQGNGCEACTLARVVLDPGYLRNLRVAIVSRMHYNGDHRFPRFLRFIDLAIDSYVEFAATIMAESTELASGFKRARKIATSLSRSNRRSYQEVEMYLRGQPEHVHPAIRQEMFEKEQEHHRRYQHEKRYGSHIGHRHSVHCSNARPNRHSAHCPNGKHRSQRGAITDDFTPHFQQMSLNEGSPRAPRCGMHCASRHSHMPPVPRHASTGHRASASRHAPTSHMPPAPGHAPVSHRASASGRVPTSHRSSSSRHAPSGSGSRTMQSQAGISPSGRRENDEDALADQYTHLVSHNAAYGWDTDDSDASTLDVPDDEPSHPSNNRSGFMKDGEQYRQQRQQRQR